MTNVKTPAGEKAFAHILVQVGNPVGMPINARDADIGGLSDPRWLSGRQYECEYQPKPDEPPKLYLRACGEITELWDRAKRSGRRYAHIERRATKCLGDTTTEWDYLVDVHNGHEVWYSARHATRADAEADLLRLAPQEFRALLDAPKARNGAATNIPAYPEPITLRPLHAHRLRYIAFPALCQVEEKFGAHSLEYYQAREEFLTVHPAG